MSTLANGRFDLLTILGSGATSQVWRARDTVLGVDRAVKVVAGAQGLRDRGLNEARALARIEHPNILRIYDVGEEDGQLWVVMELAEGGSLEDQLQGTGPLAPRDAVDRTLDVLAALGAAHAHGVVHRDVKPANILLGPRGNTLLADFGIARLPVAVAVRETRAGALLGSFGFMPPEQRMDARKVGPAADVYATGATLYSLITGANPVDLFLADESSPRWSGVPRTLVPVIRRAVRPAPEERYASAEAFAAALRALPDLEGSAPVWAEAEPTQDSPPLVAAVEPPALEARPPTPPPLPQPAPADPPARRRRFVPALIGLATIAAGIALSLDRPAPPTPIAPIATPASTPSPSPPVSPPTPAPSTPAPSTPAPSTPAPAASPTPAPAPRPRRAAAAAASFGRWTGTFGGRTATLDLDGAPDALHGRFQVTANGRVVTSPVTGSFDPANGQLSLRDVEDTPDAGTYTARLSGGRLTGSFTRADGGRLVPLVLDAGK